ncbi:Leucine-rich repeat-containing protein 27 [Galemys pyrenaicus]|uniref:Leucine-rich repeat-containing protein 27 n=1 Tax=Galemys pyrenaicus TaxID=202257 RepID=A0A8J6A9C3_GALPY|nr:Leucine-rich repeat-containing protein 27 [Galemys pyrenaicus]
MAAPTLPATRRRGLEQGAGPARKAEVVAPGARERSHPRTGSPCQRGVRGSGRHLKALLLEKNPIRMLPVELGERRAQSGAVTRPGAAQALATRPGQQRPEGHVALPLPRDTASGQRLRPAVAAPPSSPSAPSAVLPRAHVSTGATPGATRAQRPGRPPPASTCSEASPAARASGGSGASAAASTRSDACPAGSVSTLRALNLRQCPLEFPPQLIVQKGLVSILTFLRLCSAECAAAREWPSPENTPVARTELSQLPLPRLGLSADSAAGREPRDSPEPQSPGAPGEKDPGDLLPPVDRPGPSGPRKADALDNWPSREEIRRFWKLRQEIVEQEQAEALGTQLLPVELPPNLKAALSSRERGRADPRGLLRGRTRGLAGPLPELTTPYRELVRARRLERSHAAACREPRQKRALPEQPRRGGLRRLRVTRVTATGGLTAAACPLNPRAAGQGAPPGPAEQLRAVDLPRPARTDPRSRGWRRRAACGVRAEACALPARGVRAPGPALDAHAGTRAGREPPPADRGRVTSAPALPVSREKRGPDSSGGALAPGRLCAVAAGTQAAPSVGSAASAASGRRLRGRGRCGCRVDAVAARGAIGDPAVACLPRDARALQEWREQAQRPTWKQWLQARGPEHRLQPPHRSRKGFWGAEPLVPVRAAAQDPEIGLPDGGMPRARQPLSEADHARPRFPGQSWRHSAARPHRWSLFLSRPCPGHQTPQHWAAGRGLGVSRLLAGPCPVGALRLRAARPVPPCREEEGPPAAHSSAPQAQGPAEGEGELRSGHWRRGLPAGSPGDGLPGSRLSRPAQLGAMASVTPACAGAADAQSFCLAETG